VGLAIERCVDANAPIALRTNWNRFLGLMTGLIVTAAAVALMMAFWFREQTLIPIWPALGYVGVCGVLALIVFRARSRNQPARAYGAVIGLAGFLALTFTGVLTDFRLQRSENAAQAMRQLKERLPPDQQLVSLDGHTDSLFAYYYGSPTIAPRKIDGAKEKSAMVSPYFCIVCEGSIRPTLPFQWKEIGSVSVDRNHHAIPERMVIVGRRLPDSDPLTGFEEGKPANYGTNSLVSELGADLKPLF
jgi:hypothetical protein